MERPLGCGRIWPEWPGKNFGECFCIIFSISKRNKQKNEYSPKICIFAQKSPKSGKNHDLDSDLLIVAGYGRNVRKKFLGDVFASYFPFLRGISKKTKNDKNFQFCKKLVQKNAKT